MNGKGKGSKRKQEDTDEEEDADEEEDEKEDDDSKEEDVNTKKKLCFYAYDLACFNLEAKYLVRLA